jgi:hypothetical protein
MFCILLYIMQQKGRDSFNIDQQMYCGLDFTLDQTQTVAS